ncbi:uncharacterized protein LOC112565971 isoform X2 [Pomacea canaliculata]|uniref:uncharacterized protein LOC112565971 isoform X2 n=1 Tax=Pomacea canaliculata TaxID=400727 RepID=UPI000D739C89|nr:uncharacterized protein LOC112565971 isoform X2 [Pomacea canaliculata]
MAAETSLIDTVKLRFLACKHSPKYVGVGVGVASVVLGLSAWSLIASSSRMTECPPVRSKPVPAGGESSGSGSDPAGGAGCNAESCPWHYVVSDIANRLHLLEMAFKEQVVAREMIAQEVSNQSDSNSAIEQKLGTFLRRLEQVENMIRMLETRQQELTARLHSDEFVGFLIILAIMVEVMLRVRPKVGEINPWGLRQRMRLSPNNRPRPTSEPAAISTPTLISSTVTTAQPRAVADMTRQEVHENNNGGGPQNGVSFSPKHGLFLRPELCIIAFRRDNPALTSFVDSTLRHLDDIKVSVRPYYLVENHDHLRHCPRTRLYLVIFEMEERVGSSSRGHDSDLITSTVRYIKSLGASIILVVTNDEGSKKLTAHALYNTHLRLLQSHEAFQDLTSTGRVFSSWRELTSHQLSHMRKIVKTALNLKTGLR